MKIYSITQTQLLPITIEQAWSFFSKPSNLSKITPDDMKFDILSMSGGQKMYAGQIIEYKIKAPPGISMNWVTEITHVNSPNYFVDEQRVGPYALWHHQHHFKAVVSGVEMTDEVHYALPAGILGRLAHSIFVKQELQRIFNYRFDAVNELITEIRKNGNSV